MEVGIKGFSKELENGRKPNLNAMAYVIYVIA